MGKNSEEISNVETQQVLVWRDVGPVWGAREADHGRRTGDHRVPQEDTDQRVEDAEGVPGPVQLSAEVEQEQWGDDGLHGKIEPASVGEDEGPDFTERQDRAVPVPPEGAWELRGEADLGELEQRLEPWPRRQPGELRYRVVELMIIWNYYNITMSNPHILRG